jgi:valyl-tRNA synthetase
MRARYESWIEGLNGDWLISRQRYFGVAFPVWYPIDATGEVQHDAPILAAEATLPVDPSSDVPPGYDESQRDQPNGFTADSDVMDTWATSSLTPEIVCGWVDDPDLFERTFPMDMRPQALEIIRTWLFSTVVRSHFEFGDIPWAHAAISGWVLDPDRKKMSKSKGNVVTPMEWLEKYGSDAVRHWAASGGPGVDTAFDEAQLKIGRKLAIKVLNASKFVLSIAGDASDDLALVTEPIDRSMLAHLATVVDDATIAFEAFDYARALERTERFFWNFCDDYVELVKGRAYAGSQSAAVALRCALSTLQRMFAPFLPFVTEEVWSWWHDDSESVHRSPWPDPDGPRSRDGDALVYQVASDVIGAIRKTKSEQRVSLATPVERAVVRDTEARLRALEAARRDVEEAGKVKVLETEVADSLSVKVELADLEP